MSCHINSEHPRENFYKTFSKPPLLPNFCVWLILAGLEILNVFLRLKSSSSLTLNKIEHFSRVSLREEDYFEEDYFNEKA